MVTLIRVEAEALTLKQAIKDIEDALRVIETNSDGDLRIHDEHYERVPRGFRGRRVYRLGDKPSGANPILGASNATTAPVTFTYATT